jgi:hypothetical protein
LRFLEQVQARWHLVHEFWSVNEMVSSRGVEVGLGTDLSIHFPKSEESSARKFLLIVLNNPALQNS